MVPLSLETSFLRLLSNWTEQFPCGQFSRDWRFPTMQLAETSLSVPHLAVMGIVHQGLPMQRKVSNG